tara:strand:- start:158 stop:478 length:321 start_codon:yes stop_codon:yes gene_type:complete
MSLEGSICAASPALCLIKDAIYGHTEHFIGAPALTGPLAILLNILQVLVFIYALYLSFKCNDGFKLGDFLLACCCSSCYVAYRLAVPCKRNILKEIGKSLHDAGDI